MKNSMHKKDIEELCDTLRLDSIDKIMALHILEIYSIASAYTYINYCIIQNKTNRETIIAKSYKLFTTIIKQVKQLKNGTNNQISKAKS